MSKNTITPATRLRRRIVKTAKRLDKTIEIITGSCKNPSVWIGSDHMDFNDPNKKRFIYYKDFSGIINGDWFSIYVMIWSDCNIRIEFSSTTENPNDLMPFLGDFKTSEVIVG